MSARHDEPQPGPKGGPGVLGPWSEWPRRETATATAPRQRRLSRGIGAAMADAVARCIVPRV